MLVDNLLKINKYNIQGAGSQRRKVGRREDEKSWVLVSLEFWIDP